MTLEEQANNAVQLKHARDVLRYLNIIIVALMQRGEVHDESKLHPPEVEGFTANTANLAGSTYNSPEYQARLKCELKTALDHHYAVNRHHPQHFPNGVDDMNLVDVVEMFCDWKAATLKHNDGNILTSIHVNTTRFNLSPQLRRIFENTAQLFEGK